MVCGEKKEDPMLSQYRVLANFKQLKEKLFVCFFISE